MGKVNKIRWASILRPIYVLLLSIGVTYGQFFITNLLNLVLKDPPGYLFH